MTWRRIRDDRGDSIPLTRSYFWDKRPWEDHTRHTRIWGTLLAVPLVPGWFLLRHLTLPTIQNWQGWSHPAWIWVALGWTVLLGGTVIGVRFVWAFQRREDRRVSICPACGADLRAAHPDRDGCTVCRVCGGAWRLGTPKKSAAQRKRRIRNSPIVDDRGVEHNASRDLTPQGLLPPPDDPRVPMTKEGRRAYHALWLGSLGFLVVTLAGLYLSRNSKSDWVLFAVVIIGTVPFLVGGLTFMVMLTRHVMPVMARRMVLDGRCPSCASTLDGTPEADGCTECEQCGAAWRVPKPGEITTRPCPTCGYELAGLSPDETLRIPCPECGEAWYFGDG